MKRILWELWLAPRNLAILLMKAYRRIISPLYGDVCRYYPTCSRYSMEAYQQRGFLMGIALTIWRLLRCNPFSGGGIDDVPSRKVTFFDINSSGFVRPRIRKA
ncbi:membrane protein insertion efficiency factor YidD [Leucobacter sp. G161]|uniref:membrane protein insertion efficiency factor YidD n=1 Tax=Leucobacter sp. G161 TaxID=663704 RepID=UPI00073B3ADF|nr:membrane protein insertion efficiency factor YidD [Leucobacter sp. G161]KUF06049.1 membrane protein insertion efficiency factor YidD [Leucobacter sp. G161]